MRAEDFSALALARFALHLQACQPTRLPMFLGSTLRGAFGHALKKAICVVEHGNCAACPVAEHCWYPYLFETAMPPALAAISRQQDAPRPFILVPPLVGRAAASHQVFAAGEKLCFHLTLLQEAQTALPYVIYAMAQMAQQGLGVTRARFALAEVVSLNAAGAAEPIYSGHTRQLQMPTEGTTSLQNLIAARLRQLKVTNQIKLRFVTPTRIRVAGEPQEELTFPLLVRFLLRRISLLLAVHGGITPAWEANEWVDRAAAVETLAAVWSWLEVDRYSNRQQRKVKTSGFLGEIVFAGERIPEFFPLLIAGEFLHVGSNATFGFGKYEIVG